MRSWNIKTMKSALILLSVFLAFVFSASAQAQTPFTASYKGHNTWTWFGDTCTSVQRIEGFAPDDGQRHPLAVYVHGTLSDWSGAKDGKMFAREAAKQGFTGASVFYDSWLTLNEAGVKGHAKCIYRAGAGSAITALCAQPSVDCGLGIVVMGHSQGAAISALAKNHDSRVRGAYLIGAGGPVVPAALAQPEGTRVLPNNRLRIIDSVQDWNNSTNATDIPKITGRDCGTNPDCLAADGSGYYIVQNNQLADGDSDHCYPWGGCTKDASLVSSWDPGWMPPATTKWGYQAALDWLKGLI